MTLGGLWSAVIGQAEARTPTRPNGTRTGSRRCWTGMASSAQPVIDKENIPGGYSALYPVLNRMEEHGRLVRGMFRPWFGAAQFAERDTVDALRHPSEHRGQSVVALSVLDPANLSGSAIAVRTRLPVRVNRHAVSEPRSCSMRKARYYTRPPKPST